MKHLLRFALMLAAVLCVSSLPAWAGVIFDDFGPGYNYNCCTGWTVTGAASPVGMEYYPANLFTAATSGNVTQIDLALARVDDASGGATVSLWTNNAGLPGVQLGSWNVTATEDFGDCCVVITIPGLTGPSLTAGQSYFMLIFADSTSWDVWNFNPQGVTGLGLFSHNGGTTWTDYGIVTLGAFDILGGPATIPEPATMLLLGAGLLCVLAHARKRAVR